MWIALIAGSFKPFTSGHYNLVSTAASENDEVHLFVSKKDRKRKDEFPIHWNSMKVIWKKFIQPTLPSNVTVHYTDNPTTSQFEMMVDAEKNPYREDNVYVIYAGKDDINRYNNPRIKERTLKNLFKNNQLIFKALDRKDISGTKAREALENEDLETFVFYMPDDLKQYGHQIFEILRKEA